MNNLVSIDPGVNATGMAVFVDKRLVLGAYVESGEGFVGSAAKAVMRTFAGSICPESQQWQLVIERPKVYQSRFQKGDQKDIEDLLLEVGALSALWAGPVQLVYPQAWKGQVPKDAMGRRIEEKLSGEESSAIHCRLKSKRHNVLDAIGIGLKFLGRL